MPNTRFAAALVCLVAAMPLASAAPEPPAHQHDEGATAQAGARPGGMMEQAQAAKSQAERSRLMAENMAAMKARMAEMKGMMGQGSMMGSGAMMGGQSMPMTMDAAQMDKMHRHMAMMQDMMERLMIQQDLMMKSSK